MKKTLLFAMLLAAMVGAKAQTVFEDFETVTAYENVEIDSWINYSEIGEAVWEGREYNNNKYASMASYSTGEANKVWLITPSVDMDADNSERLEFDVNIGFYTHDALSVMYSTDFDGSDVTTATWVDITDNFTIPQEPTDGYGVFAPAGRFDMDEITGTAVVAFVYEGDDNNGQTTTIQIDNVQFGAPGADIVSFELDDQVSGAKINRTEKTVDITVFPNTDVTALTPTITLSTGATSTPASGTAVDFTDTVTYTVNSSEAGISKDWKVIVHIMSNEATPIEDIQFVENPAEDDASLMVGMDVLVRGIVTGTSENTFYMQDKAAEWSGIYVYAGSSIEVTVAVGDSVEAIGQIKEYYGVTELAPVRITKIEGRKPLPAPLNAGTELTEAMEGVLVKAGNVLVSEDNDAEDGEAFQLATFDDNTTMKIYDELFAAFVPEAGVKYDVTGVVAYAYSHFRLSPTKLTDYESALSTPEFTAKNALSVYPNPASTTINIAGANVEYVQISNVIGQVVLNVNVVNKQLNISTLENGIYFILVNDSVVRFVKE